MSSPPPELYEPASDPLDNDTVNQSDGIVTDQYEHVADDKSSAEGDNHSVSIKQDDERRFGHSSQLQHLIVHPVTTASNHNTNNEQNLIDLIIYWIHGFFGFLSTWSRNAEDSEKQGLITDDEIDKLAVFQGSVTNFLQLHKGQVAPQKILEMQALLNNDNHGEWERRLKSFRSRSRGGGGMIQQLETFRAKLKAYLGTWNHTTGHCSENIYLLDDGFTIRRIPTVNQTDAVRCKLGVMSGVHAWDLKVTGPIGTHFSLGLTTEKAPLNSMKGYVSLIGDDEEGQSWGWDVIWGNLSHKGKTIRNYPRRVFYEHTPNDIIRLILDCDKGDMSFAVNETFFGVAFKKLPKDVPLYPTVGLVFGNMEVSLLYLGVPPPLQN